MYNPYAEGTKITLGLDLFAEEYSEKEIGEVYYDLTADPEQELLLLESASFQEIDDHYNPGELEMILEAIKIKRFSQTDSKMLALVRVLNKNTKNNISVETPIIGKPRKSGLFATVTVQIPFSDGQVLSIVFHSPGGNERKILSEDAIIAFRWLLNKRDVTHVVSPEKGQDVSLEKIAKRVMQIVAKNSEAFQKKQAQIKAQKAELEETIKTVKAQETKKQEMMGSIADLDEKAGTLDEDIDILKARVEKIKQENADLETQLESLRTRKSEQREPNDIRGYSYAIEKDGKVIASGSISLMGDSGHETSKLEYYKDLADRVEGKLYLGKEKGFSEERPDEPLIMGKDAVMVYDAKTADRESGSKIEDSDTKEPWERTKEEWISAKAKELHDQAVLKNNVSLQSRANSDAFKREAGLAHEKAIRKALSENKPVPPEVLADYPDLAEQQSGKDTKLDKIQASIAIGNQPDEAPSGSIIFNAARPIYGHNEWQGDFAYGRFYAAVDPNKDRADWMIEENRTLDAWILEYIPREEFIARARAYFRNAFPKLADKAEEKYSDDQFIESYKNYIGKKVNTYGEVKAELAKPVGNSAKPEPEKEEIPILPSKQQKGNPAKRAAKILHSLKLEEKAVKDGFHIKLKNGEYQDLSIETHDSEHIDKADGSRRIYLTQYIKEGGDLIIDSEMVFLANAYTGYLKLVEIGHQGPFGEIRKTSIGRPENSWANIFSKNLIDQGYDKASPAEDKESLMLLDELDSIVVGNEEGRPDYIADKIDEVSGKLAKEGVLDKYQQEINAAKAVLADEIAKSKTTDTEPDLDEATLQIAENLLDGQYDDMPMDEISDLIEPVFDLDEDKHMGLMEKVDSYATELTKKKAQAI
jgi:hypothetical protein